MQKKKEKKPQKPCRKLHEYLFVKCVTITHRNIWFDCRNPDNSSGHQFSTVGSVLKLPNVMTERNQFNAFAVVSTYQFYKGKIELQYRQDGE